METSRRLSSRSRILYWCAYHARDLMIGAVIGSAVVVLLLQMQIGSFEYSVPIDRRPLRMRESSDKLAGVQDSDFQNVIVHQYLSICPSSMSHWIHNSIHNTGLAYLVSREKTGIEDIYDKPVNFLEHTSMTVILKETDQGFMWMDFSSVKNVSTPLSKQVHDAMIPYFPPRAIIKDPKNLLNRRLSISYSLKLMARFHAMLTLQTPDRPYPGRFWDKAIDWKPPLEVLPWTNGLRPIRILHFGSCGQIISSRRFTCAEQELLSADSDTVMIISLSSERFGADNLSEILKKLLSGKLSKCKTDHMTFEEACSSTDISKRFIPITDVSVRQDAISDFRFLFSKSISELLDHIPYVKDEGHKYPNGTFLIPRIDLCDLREARGGLAFVSEELGSLADWSNEPETRSVNITLNLF